MKDIIDSYEKSSSNFIGNSNSLHKLGLNSRKLEEASTKQILEVLNLYNKEVIYTSGNAESYTLILNNIPDNKKIITDNKEFYDIGREMNKNIILDKDLNIDEDTYLVSTEKDLNLGKVSCLKHISLKEGYKNYNNYDFITIEEDIPFFGCLIKDKNKELEPIIHGGKSTTKYRSGTSALPLIVSFSKLIKNKYKK